MSATDFRPSGGRGGEAPDPARPVEPCTADKHGTASAWRRQGCTCTTARIDKKRYGIEYRLGRPRTVDSTGTRRRIQALMAIGWTGRQIMAELGWAGASLGAQVYQSDRVYRATATRVTEVYDRLSMTPGPSSTTRRRAARAGWLPPLAWDDDTIDDPAAVVVLKDSTESVDDVAVERALDPHESLPVLNRNEKRVAFALLLEQGWSATQAGGRLRLSGSTTKVWAAALTADILGATG